MSRLTALYSTRIVPEALGDLSDDSTNIIRLKSVWDLFEFRSFNSSMLFFQHFAALEVVEVVDLLFEPQYESSWKIEAYGGLWRDFNAIEDVGDLRGG